MLLLLTDPMFFLHHAQVDRLWWIWQQQSPATRTFAYNGFHNANNPDGSNGPPVSLDDLLPMLGLGADVTVRSMMDVRGGSLCYTY